VDVTDAGLSGGVGGEESACKRGVMGGETDPSTNPHGERMRESWKAETSYHQEGASPEQLPA
jgi:hypothetical protein